MLIKNRNAVIHFALVFAALLLSSCRQGATVRTGIPATQSPTAISETPMGVETQAQTAIDPQALKNLEYRLGIVNEAQGDSNAVIKLVNGLFEQPIQNSSAKVQVNYVDSAIGDLNGDGIEDAAVVLAVNTGGTGTFMQLAAVLNQNGQLIHADTADLGDRTKVESIQIEDGTIKVQTIVHSDTDPQCCPSLEKVQEFVLQNGRFVRQESQ